MVQTLKKDNKGFTLVELLVVVAILGILAVVLVPQYVQYLETSRYNTDVAQMNELVHAVEVAAAAAEGAIPSSSVVITVTKPDAYSVTSGTAPQALTDELAKIVPNSGTKSFRSSAFTGGTKTITLTSSGTATASYPAKAS